MEAAISIDIGGTYTKIALVEEGYRIVGQARIETKKHNTLVEYFEAIFDSIESIKQSLSPRYNIIGVGIGAPCSNTLENKIEGAANVSFLNEVSITSAFEGHFGLPAFLINDGNAAALGEGLKGAAQGLSDYILITLGTGLGCGIIVNGKVVGGWRGMAGEFGHVSVRRNKRVCGCGGVDCLETYVSATGLKRTAFELLSKQNHDSPLRALNFNQVTAKMIYEMAIKGDWIARRAFEFTGEILGEKLADLITLFEPKAIFLSGGVASAGNLLLEPTIASARKNLLPIYRTSINIKVSSLGVNEAALLGCASLVFKQKNKLIYEQGI